jgi:hypothetical protein
MIPETTVRGEIAPNSTNAVIPISNVLVRRRRVYAARARDASCVGVTVGIPTNRDPRGSPFQLPTRLADGLGLESGLDILLPDTLRPAPGFYPGNLGPPHPASGRKPELGGKTNKIIPGACCQGAHLTRCRRGVCVVGLVDLR